MNGTHKLAKTPARRNRIALVAALSLGTALAVSLSAPADAAGSGPVMSGRAYGVGLTNARVLGAALPDSYAADTGPVSSSVSTETAPCTNIPSGPVRATLLCSRVSIDGGRKNTYAWSSVATAHVGLPGLPVIDATAIEADSVTGCYTGLDGDVGNDGYTTIAYLRVGPTVVIDQPTEVAPNTKVSVGAVSLTLNEQLVTPGRSSGAITVNAIHVRANVAGLVTADAVISSATSGAADCYRYVD